MDQLKKISTLFLVFVLCLTVLQVAARGAVKKEKTKTKDKKKISFDKSWEYGSYSKIHSGKCTLYYADEDLANGVTVCVNAGHGTKGGSSERTQSHPDGSPKIVSGTNSAGEITSYAISEGMTFPDGTEEAEATLSLARILKKKLLAKGYHVLMIREKDDVQLDNIARTVMANNNADCHIALHYDSTESDKGAFFMSVPDDKSYRNMEPVKSFWKEHHKLGSDIIEGLEEKDISIYGDGKMAMDLTQTSYSTIPSIDLEVGDGGSDISETTQEKIAAGIVMGIDKYYQDGNEDQSD